ncbi:MAG: hypothetical protein DHS20C21_13890 [Gemmatimonadota bacterium]|nr:MAG: hypothetical protein DHS20C21_13890 [Gemmatimonadota bacterium]
MRITTPLCAALLMAAAPVLNSCSDTGTAPVDQTPGAADPKDQNQASASGDYAVDFLSDALFEELIVEIDYVSGFAPSASALETLEDTLVELCRKPVGISVIVDDGIAPEPGAVRGTADIVALELQHRDFYRDPATKVAVLYCIYLDGRSDRDEGNLRVLGLAYRGSSCAMFLESIEASEPGLPLFAEIEDTVLLHEAGHLLGLVNNGTPMVAAHEDTEHPAHDSSADCIMHWLIETQNVVDVLLTGKPDFDAECRADMIANGGRAPGA